MMAYKDELLYSAWWRSLHRTTTRLTFFPFKISSEKSMWSIPYILFHIQIYPWRVDHSKNFRPRTANWSSFSPNIICWSPLYIRLRYSTRRAAQNNFELHVVWYIPENVKFTTISCVMRCVALEKKKDKGQDLNFLNLF